MAWYNATAMLKCCWLQVELAAQSVLATREVQVSSSTEVPGYSVFVASCWFSRFKSITGVFALCFASTGC